MPYAMLNLLCIQFAGFYKALCYACAMPLVRWYLQSLVLCLRYAFSSLVFTKPYAMPLLGF
jgi:hypothetical protein